MVTGLRAAVLITVLATVPAAAEPVATSDSARVGTDTSSAAASTSGEDSRPDTGPWSVREEMLEGGYYRITLELRVLHTGGDGDARSLVQHRAEAMVRAQHMAGYEILSLEEGVRSGWFWGTRYAVAEIRLVGSAAWPGL